MKWLKRLQMMRISKIVIAVSLALSVIFAGFTIYGNKVGNFIINVSNDGAHIAATMKEDLSDLSSRLSVSGLEGQGATTYEDIPRSIARGIGNKSDTVYQTYMAFSFYLVNKTERSVDYDMSLNVVDSVGRAIDIMRVMINEGDAEGGDIYANPEASEEGENWLKQHTSYETIAFISEKQLMAKRVTDFQPEDKVKYTIVIWVEGWDMDCTDERLQDRIKMKLDFYAY